MILGVVTDDHQAVIHLTVRGPAGQENEIDAIIDTGFDGWLSLPSSIIISLDLPWRQRGRALLADGSESIFDIYEAIVLWDGGPLRIAVHEAETTPLIGMSLFRGYELIIQNQPGGKVSIRSLAEPETR